MSKQIKNYRSMNTSEQFYLRNLIVRHRRLATAAGMRGDYDAMSKHMIKALELGKDLVTYK